MRRAALLLSLLCGFFLVLARSEEPSSADLQKKAKACLARTDGEIRVAGLREPVEVLRDKWGVAHVYAKNADDLFFDAKRHRAYVACGSGQIDIFERRGASLKRRTRIATSSGARTALLSPDLDRLFVAARAEAGRPAAILVYRPQ